MNTIKRRIGNDRTIRWTITRGLVPEDFQGKVLDVQLLDPFGKAAKISYTIEGNVVTISFLGRDQSRLGEYNAVLCENRGEVGMVTLNHQSVITLVATSEEEGGESCSNVEVDEIAISGDITSPERGLSAYEVAVAQGFVGNVDEWLASLEGMSLYELMVAEGKFTGTLEEFLAEYDDTLAAARQATADSTEQQKTVVATMEVYATAERGRVAAEEKRVAAEKQREQNTTAAIESIDSSKDAANTAAGAANTAASNANTKVEELKNYDARVTELETGKADKSEIIEEIKQSETGELPTDGTKMVVDFSEGPHEDDDFDGMIVPEAPSDGKRYSRKDKAWVDSEPEGGYRRSEFESYGAVWNPETKFYEFNTLTDLTYEDMCRVVDFGIVYKQDISRQFYKTWKSKLRTTIGLISVSGAGGLDSGCKCEYAFTNSGINVIALTVGNMRFRPTYYMDFEKSMAFNCGCHTILSSEFSFFSAHGKSIGSKDYPFFGQKLENINMSDIPINIYLGNCEVLTYKSIQRMIKKAGGTNQREFTFHPSRYNLLTGAATEQEYLETGHTREEWMAIVTDATSKNISIVKDI